MTDAPKKILAWLDQGPESRASGRLEGEWGTEEAGQSLAFSRGGADLYYHDDTVKALTSKNEALMVERANIIKTNREQWLALYKKNQTLTSERDALQARVAELEEKSHKTFNFGVEREKIVEREGYILNRKLDEFWDSVAIQPLWDVTRDAFTAGYILGGKVVVKKIK